MGGKNVVIGAVLSIVIVVALVVIAKKSGIVSSKPPPPPSVLGQMITRVETKAPYKEVTLALSEWEKRGPDAQGRYKNPETREYDLVSPIMCASCAKTVPEAVYPVDVLAMPAEKRGPEKVRVRNEYLCPLCKKPAYTHETY
jgi:hypothetical protein